MPLLLCLLVGDFALLQPHLTHLTLPLRKVLQTRGRKIEAVYFLESGIASIVMNAGPAHTIEVGVVGREGNDWCGHAVRVRRLAQ